MHGGANRAKWAYINSGNPYWGKVYGILKNRGDSSLHAGTPEIAPPRKMTRRMRVSATLKVFREKK